MKKVLIIGFCVPDAKRLSLGLVSLFKVRVVQLERIYDLKEYLKEKEADLIVINRVIDADKSSGMEILDHLRLGNTKIPTVITTGIVKYQKEVLRKGATLTFDLDLLIGTIGKKRQKQKDEIVLRIREILRQVN